MTARSERSRVTYNLPLTAGDPTKAVIIVPVDLTVAEAQRISRFILAVGDLVRERDAVVTDD